MNTSKKILFLLLISCVVLSCSSLQKTMFVDENIKKVEVGMTKQQVVTIMGKSYEAISARANEATLGYKTNDGSTYLLFFVNGQLDEWYKEQPLNIGGSNKVNISIKKDIFGHLNFNGENGKSATLKTDIFDNHIYTDSNGNSIEYGKDIWGGVMKQYDNDEQLFFNFLIEKYLYGYTHEYRPRRY